MEDTIKWLLDSDPWVRYRTRIDLLEMINLLTTKADENNRYYADSVWMAWKDWDFGQKKDPSPWITFLVARILKRAGHLKQTHSFEPSQL